MKKSFRLIPLFLGGLALVLPFAAAERQSADVYNLLYPKQIIERSPDLEVTRPRALRKSMSRGQKLFLARQRSEGTKASPYRIMLNKNRSHASFEIEQPGLTPWEETNWKHRIRRGFEMTDMYEKNFQKPEIEANKGRVRNVRHNRPHKEDLDGTRSGRNKLYRLYFR